MEDTKEQIDLRNKFEKETDNTIWSRVFRFVGLPVFLISRC